MLQPIYALGATQLPSQSFFLISVKKGGKKKREEEKCHKMV